MKKQLSYLFSALVLFGLVACSTPQPQNYGGLALYTLRDTMSTAPKEVLKEVKSMGYAYVEAAGYNTEEGTYYGMEPAEFKAYMDEIGLIPMSSHQSSMNLDNADQEIADAVEAGFRYIVVPIPPNGHFRYFQETQSMGMSNEIEEVTEILNTMGEKASAAGIQLLYHNHDFELKENENGIVPLDYFLENTDPANVNFQLDLYWATRAGVDPVAYFENYPGRFKSWHVKDMDTEGRFAPVGNGTIDFARILENKDSSGMEYYFVEQDRTFTMTPMEAAQTSRAGLEKFGFK